MTKKFKKYFLCILVILCLSVSSLSVFAVDSRYTYNNFGGYIYTAVPDTYTAKVPEKDFALIGVVSQVPVSKLETFLIMSLEAGGYNFPTGSRATTLLDNFRKAYAPFSRKFQFQNEAITNFLASSLYEPDSSSADGLFPVCRFSADFLQYLRFLLELFFDSNGIDSSTFNYSVFPTYVNGTDWANDTSSMIVYYFHNTGMTYLSVDGIYFSPVSHKIAESAGTGLNGFFANFVQFVDINSFTSWLPPTVAGPVIASWSVFLGLAGLLVTLKILHG